MESQEVLQPAMVDRVEELALLHKRINEAGEGLGAIAVVAGEEGVGKTRLLEEAAGIAQAQNMLLLRGAANATVSGMPFGLFNEVLAGFLKTAVANEREDLRDVVAELAPLLWQSLFPDEELPEEKTAEIEPKLGQSLFLARVGTLLLQRAQSRPVVLCLEDLHWADSVSLQLLSYLASRNGNVPLLILASLRPEHERDNAEINLQRMLQDLHRNPHVYLLELQPLSLEDLRTLIGACFPRQAFDDDLFDMLHRKSGGVPLYAMQYLEFLRQQDVLHCKDGLWVNRCIEEAEAPDSVRDTLRQRLEKLTDEERQVLSHAAVQGDTFEGALVAQTLGQPLTRVLRLLSNLMHRTRLVKVVECQFRFGHNGLAEVFYQQLSEASRRHVHLQLAKILERQRPQETEALAYHFYRAAIFDRALPHLVQAAKRARKVDAYRKVRHYLAQARQVIESGSASSSGIQHLEVLLLMAKAEERLGESNHSMELSHQVLQMGASDKEQASVAEGLMQVGGVHYRKGEWEDSISNYQRAAGLFAELGDERNIAAIHVRLGNIAFERANLEEAARCFTEAKDTALKCGDASLMGAIFGNLGVLASVRGQYVDAVLNYTEALKFYRKIKYRYGLCQVYHNLGLSHADQEDWTMALKFYGEREERARELGTVDVVANILISKAAAQIQVDELEDAETSCKQARLYMEQMKDRLGLAECRKVEGMIYRERAEYRRATECLQQGRYTFLELDNDLGVAECDLELGRLQQERGDVEEARRLLLESVQLFQQIGATDDARKGEALLAGLEG